MPKYAIRTALAVGGGVAGWLAHDEFAQSPEAEAQSAAPAPVLPLRKKFEPLSVTENLPPAAIVEAIAAEEVVAAVAEELPAPTIAPAAVVAACCADDAAPRAPLLPRLPRKIDLRPGSVWHAA